MPMSFPDMESLLNAAQVWKFREPAEGETEQHYRSVLADHVRPKDQVESMEIRTGKGWDQWDRSEGIAAILDSAGKDDEDPPADRAACLAWCKRRALRFVGLGDFPIESMLADLAKHPELEKSVFIGRLIANTVNRQDRGAVTRFIEGFN